MASQEVTITYVVDVLRQEHRNIERLLRVLEQELRVFDCGKRANYEAVLGVIDYFRDYPDSCHHPKDDMIFEKLKSRDPLPSIRRERAGFDESRRRSSEY
jgi:hemerythrin-like domain-containing protein